MEKPTSTTSKPNFDERPFIAIWEVTQACDLVCVHCRACAQPTRSRFELTTSEAEGLIDQIGALQVPVFVMTGGDPLKRPDIYDLVEYGASRGVRTSMTPSATPLLTREAIGELHRRGLARLAVSLDGSTAELHDAFRGVPGSYRRTLDAIRWARELGQPVQVNTTITPRNLNDFDSMVRLLETLDIVLWSVFFLVPTGRGQAGDVVSAEEFEAVFAKLYDIAPRVPFDIKTTEAQHYRRYILQRRAAERRLGSAGVAPALSSGLGVRDEQKAGCPPPRSAESPQPPISNAPPYAARFASALGGGNGAATRDGIGRAPRGLNDAKGFVFISHVGEVYPSGFLPLAAGNVRSQPLADIYRNSPLFVSLRDTSRLKGKCGACEFREVCGGSRARAFALTGDPFAEEPYCVYQPRAAQVA